MPANAQAVYTLDAPLSPDLHRVVWYGATAASPIFVGDNAGFISRGAGPNAMLMVKRRQANETGWPARIDISVMDDQGNLMTPLGISLRDANQGIANQGRDDFPVVTISGNVLTLSAECVNFGLTYNFAVLFTDAQGHLGLLDPPIMNT